MPRAVWHATQGEGRRRAPRQRRRTHAAGCPPRPRTQWIAAAPRSRSRPIGASCGSVTTPSPGLVVERGAVDQLAKADDVRRILVVRSGSAPPGRRPRTGTRFDADLVLAFGTVSAVHAAAGSHADVDGTRVGASVGLIDDPRCRWQSCRCPGPRRSGANSALAPAITDWASVRRRGPARHALQDTAPLKRVRPISDRIVGVLRPVSRSPLILASVLAIGREGGPPRTCRHCRRPPRSQAAGWGRRRRPRVPLSIAGARPLDA